MARFDDSRVIVTGAGSGIGFAIARAFAAAGAAVALNDMDAALAASAAHSINAGLGREQVHPYGLDVAEPGAVAGMVEAFTAAHGPLNIMVANAGITNYGAFLDYTPAAFDRLLGVNLRGSYFSAQAAAKNMIAHRQPGRILLMSSVTGEQVIRNLSAYGITKAGIRMMARCLALELGAYGITVNAISPGATLTERTLQDDPKFESNWAGVSPTGRLAYVADIAAAALFLAAPESSQITGQTLQVDGGWTLYSPLPAEHPDQPEHSSQLR